MIINTSIKSGFVNMGKEGSYFSLVSASGIVNVELRLKGSTVIDSKMWVGMSLPQAMPFDEIIITSDLDQPIELWAGKVSMSQSRYSNSAAKAIRTEQVKVEGEAQINGSDLTRTATRLRTNKDVFLGGAGVDGSGWKLKAGVTEEIPLAGVLMAYKRPAFLDASQTTFKDSQVGGFNEGVATSFWRWESDDGAVRLAHDYNGAHPMRIWTVGDPVWRDHVTAGLWSGVNWNTMDLIDLNAERGELWAVGLDSNRVGYYVSTDHGLTFKLVKLISHNMGFLPAGMGEKTTRSGSFLTTNAGAYHAVINMDTLVSFYSQKGTLNYRRVMFTDELNGYRGAPNGNDKLQRTYDGGKNWVEVGIKPQGWGMTQYAINQSGNFFIAKRSAGMVISYDFLETYETYNTSFTSGAEDSQIVFLNDSMALMACTDLKIILVYKDSSGNTAFEVVADLATHGAVEGGTYRELRVAENGVLIVGYGDDIYRFNVAIIGDLAPATVEVMELLS
ncbi:hypothetical protein Ssed_2201 [Shewanella sediminis HAW-EB3]|uniref:Uncharacterized protein n=1 Tax=Shewanella sediminis (strain HAW-EB3) TaxID=425104 RepID=A8FVD7_SHESH|nr:hypothetical protein [Shewanella sediminis]ABV36810.1 hypothetical protein Ssed_2201 [Shewanella sediminis HAW-EB3]